MTRLGVLEHVEYLPLDAAKNHTEFRLHFHGGRTCYTLSDHVVNILPGEEVYISSHGVFLTAVRSKQLR